MQTHLATLTDLLKTRNIENLRKFDEAYATYNEILPTLEYLQNLTEQAIFTAYRKVLLHD